MNFSRTFRTGVVYGGLAALLAAGTGTVYRSYRRAIDRAEDRLDAYDSHVVETSLGDVEYCVEGEGTPALVAHGICGGFDQALATGESVLGDGYRVVGVSRFGYLGSDLPDEATPERQADAYRELLDHLGIDEVVMVGASAGGPAALQFAAKYPESTRALVLVGAAVPSDDPREGPMGPPRPILRNFPFWLVTERFPSVLLSAFGLDRTTYARARLADKRAVRAVLATLLPIDPRREGVINDAEVTNVDVVENADCYDLEGITVPTLVVSAENDPLADFESSWRVAERIPTATFLPFEDGGHLVFGHSDAIRRSVGEMVAAPRR